MRANQLALARFAFLAELALGFAKSCMSCHLSGVENRVAIWF
jgi:hypothetical protein